MEQKQIPISEGAKIILDTVKDELFPAVGKLKKLLNSLQKCRVSFQLYSSRLNEFEEEYASTSDTFFAVHCLGYVKRS